MDMLLARISRNKRSGINMRSEKDRSFWSNPTICRQLTYDVSSSISPCNPALETCKEILQAVQAEKKFSTLGWRIYINRANKKTRTL
jgi:hypothetical protein